MDTATTETATTDTPRQRYARGEGDRLRDDLLDAAADLMATHGTVDQVSLRAVARAAGVSPTAVYRHFDDHLDLLREAVAYCWSNFNVALSSSFSPDDDPFEAFEACGHAYCRFAFERQGQYRVLFSNRIDLGDAETCDDDAPGATPNDPPPGGMETFQLLIDLVTRMLERRDDDRDPFVVAVQVHTWIHGIVDLCGTNDKAPWPPVDEQLDGLCEALALVPRVDEAG